MKDPSFVVGEVILGGQMMSAFFCSILPSWLSKYTIPAGNVSGFARHRVLIGTGEKARVTMGKARFIQEQLMFFHA